MGMFDYVRCRVPLPDGFEGGLQCKDFDCELTMIEIREDGTLWIERFEHEEVPADERPHPDPTDPLHFIGMLRRINERWEQIEHHGDMCFYGSEGEYGEPSYRWHEYVARFSEGTLDRFLPHPPQEERS